MNFPKDVADLDTCMKYGENYGFVDYRAHNTVYYGYNDISHVIAYVEGEADGPGWEWIVKLNNGQIWRLYGTVCHCGWDCQGSIHAKRVHLYSELPQICAGNWEKLKTMINFNEFYPQEIKIPIKNVPMTREIDVYVPKKLQNINKWFIKDPKVEV